MTESFSLPLRPSSVQGPSKQDTIAVQIAQINAERGSFRNVTEQGLRDEIEAQQRSPGTIGGEEDEASQGAEASDRSEQILKSRLEIMEFAMNAHTESTYALDFISLLLSKHAPRQAEVSMSPYLKQKAPIGSLGVDIKSVSEQSESSRKDTELVSRGWKLESFSNAADKLLEAASRLEEEVAAETKYWGEVLAIKDKGWNICRVPRERQTLGVQLGFLEATPTFRDRGLAALRRGDEGNLILDQGLREPNPKAVRVRVLKHNQTVGISSVPYRKRQPEDPFESRVRQARDALYEEELFHEIIREARGLLQHGIETRQNLVQFRTSDEQQVLVDLVLLEDWEPDLAADTRSEDVTAEAIAQALRILLSNSHRQNHRRRTQIPPPLTTKKRTTPEYSLLRPCACYIQHRSDVQWLQSFINNLRKTLRSAKLTCEFAMSPFVSANPLRDSTNHSSVDSKLPSIESLLTTFTSPFESTFTGSFVTPLSSFKLRIYTNLNPNGFGTEFELSTMLPSQSSSQSFHRFGLREDLQERLLFLYTLDIVQLISSLSLNGKSSPIPPGDAPSLRESEDEDTGNDVFSAPVTHSSDAYLMPWEPTALNPGELTAISPRDRRRKKLVVELSRDRLVLRCGWKGKSGRENLHDGSDATAVSEETDAQGTKVYSWRADGLTGSGSTEPDGTGESKSLQEIVQLASKVGP